MLFSLLKHYLDTDTVLKVSQSVYCFTTSIYLMVLKTISPGCGVRASLMLFSIMLCAYFVLLLYTEGTLNPDMYGVSLWMKDYLYLMINSWCLYCRDFQTETDSCECGQRSPLSHIQFSHCGCRTAGLIFLLCVYKLHVRDISVLLVLDLKII